MSRWTTLAVRMAGGLCLVAAALHAALIDAHLEEWWGYGLFFVVASIGQAVLGLILFSLPRSPAWPASQWRAWKRRLFLAGALGNLAVIVLYVITRTLGIPFFGPEAGEVAGIGPADLPTKLAEAGAVVLLALLYRDAREPAAAAQASPYPDGT
jgi:hypothetical protein